MAQGRSDCRLPKDAKLFADFDAAVVSDLRTSLELFGPLAGRASDGLYTPSLARPANDAPFQKITLLKRGERAGILTHPLLLANLSYSATSSPIHRGVFLARNVLGVALRQPPAHSRLEPHEEAALAAAEAGPVPVEV